MAIDLSALMSASLPTKLHVATILPAFVIGTWLIAASKKGAPLHRKLGWLFLALMTVSATTTLFIHEVNPNGVLGLSVIHLFVPLTFFGVAGAILGVRTHNIRRHRNATIGLYVGGLLIAGALTFAPGRIMHQIFFS